MKVWLAEESIRPGEAIMPAHASYRESDERVRSRGGGNMTAKSTAQLQRVEPVWPHQPLTREPAGADNSMAREAVIK